MVTPTNINLDITTGATSAETNCTQVTHSQRNNDATLPTTNLTPLSTTDNNYTNKTILDITNDRLSDNFVLSTDEFGIDTVDEILDLNRTRKSNVDSVYSNPTSDIRITNQNNFQNNFQNGLSEISNLVSPIHSNQVYMTQQLNALTNKASDLEHHIQLLSSLTTALTASLQQNAQQHYLYQNTQQPDEFSTPSESGTGRKRIMDNTSYKTPNDTVKRKKASTLSPVIITTATISSSQVGLVPISPEEIERTAECARAKKKTNHPKNFNFAIELLKRLVLYDGISMPKHVF